MVFSCIWLRLLSNKIWRTFLISLSLGWPASTKRKNNTKPLRQLHYYSLFACKIWKRLFCNLILCKLAKIDWMKNFMKIIINLMNDDIMNDDIINDDIINDEMDYFVIFIIWPINFSILLSFKSMVSLKKLWI